MHVLDLIPEILHNLNSHSTHGDNNGKDEEVSEKSERPQERKESAVVKKRSPRT